MLKNSLICVSVFWLASSVGCNTSRGDREVEPQAVDPSSKEPTSASTTSTKIDRGQNRTMNILFVLTSHSRVGDTGKETGFYLSEVSHVYYQLRQAGAHITFASIRGGKAPIDGADRKDEDNARFLDDSEVMSAVANTMPLSAARASDYDAVYFPGGHGTMWDFPGNSDVERVTRGVWERGGIVAAVCHGPAALTEVKLSDGSYLVSGHEVAVFTNDEEKAVKLDQVVPFLLQSRLQERGARIRTAANWQSNVVVSGQLITGQNPASAKELGKQLLQVLKNPGDKS